MLFKKNSPCPSSYPSSQGLDSSSSSSMENLSSSLDNPSCCPQDLCLMPFILRVQQLPSVAGDVSSLLHQPCKWFSVGFQNLDFKIIWKILFRGLSTMWVNEVLVECRFPSYLLAFAVEFCNVLFGSAVHVLCWFSIVAGTFKIRWFSSPEAAQSCNSITSACVNGILF